jgi:peroxiredoxin
MIPLGTLMPEFALPDVTQANKVVRSHELAHAPVMLVMFICNHCPFVKHVRAQLAQLGKEYQAKGVAIVAISSNDIVTHPEDGPAKMAEEARDAGYTFPYLFDEDQRVAAAFSAACTPDFFVFDIARRLVYRGQLDGSRPGKYAGGVEVPVTGKDLRAALDAALDGRPPVKTQYPSIGCNIKWKVGQEPEYAR